MVRLMYFFASQEMLVHNNIHGIDQFKLGKCVDSKISGVISFLFIGPSFKVIFGYQNSWCNFISIYREKLGKAENHRTTRSGSFKSSCDSCCTGSMHSIKLWELG